VADIPVASGGNFWLTMSAKLRDTRGMAVEFPILGTVWIVLALSGESVKIRITMRGVWYLAHLEWLKVF
jgi:hypothetical protein